MTGTPADPPHIPMDIAFTIDALDDAARHAWRLTAQGDWRPCRFAEPMRAGDASIVDPSGIEAWTGRRMKKDKQHGLIARDRPRRFDFLMRGIFTHAVPHRFCPAPVPDRAQLARAIRELAPGIPWLVHLDLGGVFRALDTRHARIIGNPGIAVRGEIASSADWVGPAAADNEHLVHELWHQFLAGWLEHLTTSRMGVFVPDPDKLKDECFYLEAIRDWHPERRPT